MGIWMACVGHTPARVDAGIVGIRLDTLEWVRPNGALHRSSVAPLPPTPLGAPAHARPALVAQEASIGADGGREAAVIDLAETVPAIRSLADRIEERAHRPELPENVSLVGMFHVVDLGAGDPRPTEDRPELWATDVPAWRRAGRFSTEDATDLLRRFEKDGAGADHPSLRMVEAVNPIFVLMGRDRPVRLKLLFQLDGDLVEAPVFDRDLLGRLDGLPLGQHRPSTFGYAPGARILLTLGRHELPGTEWSVLGVLTP